MSGDQVSRRPPASGARRSRRGILAAAAGAVGLVAAETVSGAAPAQAANGAAVLQGTDNGPTTARTMVFTANSAESASLADPNTSGKGSLGVYGHGQNIGVLGDSTGTGTGVQGNGGPDHGDGVVGNGGGGAAGVVGYAGPDNGTGVVGYAASTSSGIGVAAKGGLTSGVGVQATGFLGVDATSFGTGGVGVAATGDGIGVDGEGNGVGVRGIGLDGVLGQTSTGNGVRGIVTAAGGVAVFADNPFGTALKATGRTVFSQSGILTVSAGSSRVTKTGVMLTTSSLVLATLQQNVPGVYVQSAVPNVSGSSFTVHLNKTAPARIKVAWFVIN